MLDYTGVNRNNFQDVLRAIGLFIDENHIRDICLIELKEGLLLRGVRYSEDRGGYHTSTESFLFTNEDLERIVEEAYKRRGTGGQQYHQQQQPQQQQPQQQQAKPAEEKQQRGLFGR